MNCYGLTVNDILVSITDPNRTTIIDDCDIEVQQHSGSIVIAWTSKTVDIV